jgi:mitogen-activated protein kinase kinase
MAYSIKSDVWSMGLTLHEVAHNRFPFPPEGEPPLSGPIELLNFIVAQPAPRLIDSPAEGIVWSAGAQDFLSQWYAHFPGPVYVHRLTRSFPVHSSLIRDAQQRPYPRDLLKHPWIIESSKRNINLAKWVAAVCEW